jgi:hypothetical protein
MLLSAWVAVTSPVFLLSNVAIILTKSLMSIGIGDVRDVPVGVGGGDVPCFPIKQLSLIFPKFLMFRSRDVPFSLSDSDVTCVPITQCR